MIEFELLGAIVVCLIVATLLGFFIGWLFSNKLKQEKNLEENEFDTVFEPKLTEEENGDFAILYEKEKRKNKELKGELMQKVNLLTKTTETLREAQMKNFSKDAQTRIVELEKALQKKEKELEEFVHVLVKAEERIVALSTP